MLTSMDKKNISVKVKYVAEVEDEENVLIMGRKAMVCCANDITDIAMPYIGIKKKDIDVNKYYTISGVSRVIKNNEGIRMPAIEVKSFKEAEAPKEDFVTFN